MSELVWRENWQLNDPAKLDLNPDGSFTIKDPVGDIFLPDDYIAFMRRSEGAALRDRGSCFLGQFHDGVIIFEIEWLGSLRNLRLSTRRNYYDDEAEDLLPRFFAFIGYAEPGPSDVIVNVVKGDPDYGKVYVWTPAKDPWMTGDNTRGMGWVAESFTDFMNNLTHKAKL